MNNPMEIDYTLRRIDADVWRQARSKAAAEGRTIRFVLLAFLRVYAKYGYRVVETFEDGHDDGR